MCQPFTGALWHLHQLLDTVSHTGNCFLSGMKHPSAPTDHLNPWKCLLAADFALIGIAITGMMRIHENETHRTSMSLQMRKETALHAAESTAWARIYDNTCANKAIGHRAAIMRRRNRSSRGLKVMKQITALVLVDTGHTGHQLFRTNLGYRHA